MTIPRSLSSFQGRSSSASSFHASLLRLLTLVINSSNQNKVKNEFRDHAADIGLFIVDTHVRTLSEVTNCSYVSSPVDASPPDMWDFRGWIKLPQNRNLHHPVVLTPHLMYHLYRDPKFIVLVREPVER